MYEQTANGHKPWIKTKSFVFKADITLSCYYGAKLHIGFALSVCPSVCPTPDYLRTGWMDFHGVFDKMTLRPCLVASLCLRPRPLQAGVVKWGNMRFYYIYVFWGGEFEIKHHFDVRPHPKKS